MSGEEWEDDATAIARMRDRLAVLTEAAPGSVAEDDEVWVRAVTFSISIGVIQWGCDEPGCFEMHEDRIVRLGVGGFRYDDSDSEEVYPSVFMGPEEAYQLGVYLRDMGSEALAGNN